MAKQKLSAAERQRRSSQAYINFGLRPPESVDIGQREGLLIGTTGRKFPIQVPPPGFGGTGRTSPPSGSTGGLLQGPGPGLNAFDRSYSDLIRQIIGGPGYGGVPK